MGGYGSGQRWGRSKKGTVEGCRTIDTAFLRREGLLRPATGERVGTLHWGTRNPDGTYPSSMGYRLSVGADAGSLRLTYSVPARNQSCDYAVRLEATPCHLGGVRWWFICPLVKRGAACGRRVRKLYLSSSYFGCRHCHNLAYTSSQQSDSRVYAALRGGFVRNLSDPRDLPVSQLGFALKVLTFEQKRLERLGNRLDRLGSKRAKRADPGD